MASTTVATTVRLDGDLKTEATRMLDQLGLSFNAYVVMALKQLVAKRRVPFALEVPEERIPNAATQRAMLEAEAKASGLIDDDAPSFADVESLMSYLNAD